MLTKIYVALVAVLLSTTAFAKFDENSRGVGVDLGFTRAGIAIGVEYEQGVDNTFGVGGYFRMVPDEDSGDTASPGYTTLGAFIRPHFNRENWDFYLSPGFGLLFFEPINGDGETLIGPSLQVGLLYEMSSTMAFGFDVFETWSWFGEDSLRGNVSEEVFSAKMRFLF